MTLKEVAMMAWRDHDHEGRNNNGDGTRRLQPWKKQQQWCQAIMTMMEKVVAMVPYDHKGNVNNINKKSKP
jgi:hypothetical protein